ncbi:MAG: ABC transporter permease [Actinomycetota bacterium]
MSELRWLFADARIAAWRNVMRLVRIPALLIFSVVQPLMFVLLFRYVFGGAIRGLPEGVNYVNFLLPGIFVQTAIFGSIGTGIGLTEDLATGIVDRFRSLPMARAAVLLGRTLADSVRNVVVVALMVGIGYLVGFRFETGIGPALGVVGFTLLVGFAFSWVASTIALTVETVESVQAASFIWIFPLTFLSSIFVPPQGMPAALQWIAENNPITAWADTVRTLVLGDRYLTFIGSESTLEGLVVRSLLWLGGIIAVFGFLAVRRYRNLT